jgi:hypothetical protein
MKVPVGRNLLPRATRKIQDERSVAGQDLNLRQALDIAQRRSDPQQLPSIAPSVS